MNLKGIVSVSGKSGLYKALAQNKSGFILESLDDKKTKLVTNANARIAALEEITVYGSSEDYKLLALLESMKGIKNQAEIPAANAENSELRKFFLAIAPDHDPERVYTSDIKKIISWYHIIKVHPIFNEKVEETKGDEKHNEVEIKETKPKTSKPKKTEKSDNTKIAKPKVAPIKGKKKV